MLITTADKEIGKSGKLSEILLQIKRAINQNTFPALFIGNTSNNYSAFDEDGFLRFHGNARPWLDQLGDVSRLKIQGVGVAENPTEGTVDFAANADLNDFLWVNPQFNHDRDYGVAIHPHLHFFQSSNVIPNFLIQYRWQTNGSAKVTSWTNIKCVTPAVTYVSGTILQICSTSEIDTIATSYLSDIIQIRIIRDNANTSGLFAGADTYSGSVGVLSFDIHYRVNSMGSKSEFVK